WRATGAWMGSSSATPKYSGPTVASSSSKVKVVCCSLSGTGRSSGKSRGRSTHATIMALARPSTNTATIQDFYFMLNMLQQPEDMMLSIEKQLWAAIRNSPQQGEPCGAVNHAAAMRGNGIT